MDEPLDEQIVLERIRAHLRDGKARPAATGSPPASTDDLDVDVAALRDAQDIYALAFPSQRRAVGPALVGANRLLRKLLKPSLERQVAYNAANERLVRALLAEVRSLKEAQTALERRCDALAAEIEAIRHSKHGG